MDPKSSLSVNREVLIMQRSTPRSLAFVLLGSLLSSPLLFGSESFGSLSLQEAGEGWIEWRPLVDSVGTVLRLTGPDGAVRELKFERGANPLVVLDDPAVWPDGVYVYELVLTPPIDDELRATPDAARAWSEDEAIARAQRRLPGPLVESGAFRIVGGVVVPPGLPEGAAATREDGGGGAGSGTARQSNDLRKVARDLGGGHDVGAIRIDYRAAGRVEHRESVELL
jgi:hypothetical protein